MGGSQAVVCDASVLVAMAFGEPASAQAHALTRSRRLLAPHLLRYETAQVAARNCRVAGDRADLVAQAYIASLRIPVRLVHPSWPAVLDLARRTGLSAYDASYLQIAQALSIPLATLDKRLARAAEELGLKANPGSG